MAERFDAADTPAAVEHGVPLFLQQLVETLRIEEKTQAPHGDQPELTPATTDIGRAAALHGAELLRIGYSVDQVLHDYGDICQSVTALAVEQDISISTDEFRTLNRCLDNAIADAVVAFGCARETSMELQAESLQQCLAAFAAEQQRLVNIAIQSYMVIKTGNVGLTGATGTLLIHALEELRSLSERALPEIRLACPAVAVGAC